MGFIIGLISFKNTELDTKNTTNNLKSKGYTEEEINYFNEITLKNELNSKIKKSPVKYKKDIKMFIFGDYEQNILDEAERVVSDLNNIINPIDISITENRSESNMVIYYGDYNSFISENPDLIDVDEIKNSEGFFHVKSKGNEIKSSRILINLPNQDSENDVKDVLREEITQSLGFFADSWRYPNSCFYQGSNEVLEYSDIDIKLIKMLYND